MNSSKRSWVAAGSLCAVVLACGSAGSTEPPPAAPAGRTVKVAAVQFLSKMADPAGNRERLQVKIRQAGQNGAKIVVLPETAITGYMSTDLKTTWRLDRWPLTPGLRGIHPGKYAEPVPGPSTRAFGKLAAELGIYLTVPLLEVDPKSGRYFNTLVLAGPDGRLLLHYRKLNPWPFAERGWATRGDRGHQYVDTPYGRLALLICYDINYEPRRLKKAKIDTLLYSIAWVDDAESTWYDRQLPGVAKANNINIIGANWTVPDEVNWHGYGQSRIISRTGRILAKAKRDVGEEIIYAELPVPVGASHLPRAAKRKPRTSPATGR